MNLLSDADKEKIKIEKLEKRRLEKLADNEAFYVEQQIRIEE
jgi:hypothetical protein